MERDFVRQCASSMVLAAVRRLQAEQSIIQEHARRQYLEMLANRSRREPQILGAPPETEPALSGERVGRRQLSERKDAAAGESHRHEQPEAEL